MIKYKSQPIPTTPKEYLNMLKNMWEDNWSWQQDKFWLSIFYKEVKKIKKAISWKETKERLEFITYYRKNITNKWSYWDSLIRKYELTIKDYKHEFIMENLKDYKKFLEVYKTRAPLQVWSYLNWNRYMDTWDIIEDKSRKFINDIFKEMDLEQVTIDNVLTEIQAYEKKHNKEVTDYNVRSLIHYVQTWEPL